MDYFLTFSFLMINDFRTLGTNKQIRMDSYLLKQNKRKLKYFNNLYKLIENITHMQKKKNIYIYNL